MARHSAATAAQPGEEALFPLTICPQPRTLNQQPLSDGPLGRDTGGQKGAAVVPDALCPQPTTLNQQPLLGLPLAPKVESALPDEEQAKAVKEQAGNSEVPGEDRVANRESNAD